MNHTKTFEAVNKLKDIELELHRLKNALEMANKALDAQRMAQPDNTSKLYEELRSIIDGGSESFTHNDAVQYLKDVLAQPDQNLTESLTCRHTLKTLMEKTDD
jgi:hypothetical protein